ncbi:MAG: hypothetical protein EOO06_00170 [Chitinophagaceae bacterium]|nr:MAG: hypothetical protein EOO06_00170 [Chitinophagaceae bacterium]
MKKIFAIVTLFLCSQHTYAQNMVEFTISRPYCLLNFMETTLNEHGTSSTLAKHIKEKVPESDTAFGRLVEDFSNLTLDYSYNRDEFPASRRSHRSTADLIKIAAIQSRTLGHFRMRISGILPNSEQTKLCDILKKAERYYERVISLQNFLDGRTQLQRLEEYEPGMGKAFVKLRKLYGASWSDDMPFRVALYFIPGSRGNSTASPYGNSLAVGVFTEEKDYVGRVGVVLHEMCHVLYDEQPAALQHHYDSLFNANPSPYRQAAHDYFDEGMATALGNGWAYKQLSGQLDTTEWYHDKYINGFGHALYPLAEAYINTDKTIDKAFIDSAIQLFGHTFPRATADYGVLMNRVHVYADAEDEKERQVIYNQMSAYFRFTYASMNTPILDETSLKEIKTDIAIPVIVIDRNHKANLDGIRKIYPEIASITKGKSDKNYVLSFYDKQKRPVIIVYADNTAMVKKAFELLHKEKYIDDRQPYYPLSY